MERGGSDDGREQEAVTGERPWSLAAAMEPLPPLAPPPAAPGDGVLVEVPRSARRGPGPLATAVTLVLVLVTAAVVVTLMLTVGR